MKQQNHLLPSQRKHKRMIKALAKTNPHYGKYPEDLTLEELLNYGLIILDKPSGPSSHQVVAWLREALEITHAGHGGTLDPNVTGILTIATGNATRALPILLQSGKEYVCRMRLHKPATEESIRNVMESMIGDIHQVPPLRSAVKRVRRRRSIYYLDILQIKDRDVLFRVGCEAGTYIRTLCTDVGKKLNTGAHMAELRRTKVGTIQEDECVTLTDLKDAYILYKETGDEKELRRLIQPVNRLYQNIPQIIIRDSAIDAVCHGADLAVPGVLQLDEAIKKGDLVALMSQKDEGIALATTKLSTQQIMQQDTGICATTTRVLMQRGTYPRIWNERK